MRAPHKRIVFFRNIYKSTYFYVKVDNGQKKDYSIKDVYYTYKCRRGDFS